jgi:hypothetical protein
LHLDKTNPFVTVRNDKGNKLCNIPLMAKTVNHLRHFIAEFHPGRTPDLNRPLFYSTRNNLPHKLTTDAIRIILNKYVDTARDFCRIFLKKLVAILSEKPEPRIYTGTEFRFCT